jgi:hypothetical protein
MDDWISSQIQLQLQKIEKVGFSINIQPVPKIEY